MALSSQESKRIGAWIRGLFTLLENEGQRNGK
jgi:hypothetical protein